MSPIDLVGPYPAYSALRARNAVYVDPELGMSLALSHQACSEVLLSPDLVRTYVVVEPREEYWAVNLLGRTSLLQLEGEAHHQLHALVATAIDHGHPERIGQHLQAYATEHVERLAEQIQDNGSADLITEVATPVAVEAIAELLEIPEPARSRLHDWSVALSVIFEQNPDDQRRRLAERAAQELVDELDDLVRYRSRQPGHDLMSDLVTAGLDADTVVGTSALLLLAGHEPTAGAIGNGVAALLRHHAQWQRLIDDPSLYATAVDELIRFDPPVQLLDRTAVRDTAIAGHAVRESARIAAALGAATHDSQVFSRPDELDVGRSYNPHLGFGAGAHRCLGAPVARLAVRRALTALQRRLPDLQLTGWAEHRPGIIVRSLRSLPVTT